ncbi:hypothetical protein COCSADRAFT_206831 [Bipolaris sorokiniana ND90Pr]|uniref:Uncharacterized protein n=1 Tax=Cochliobolus sativus (strain ND90Pr / ATCC 201652) TaxID=665912 RepID=M2SPL6_COCSN|nr:uncharacterized protein COCSADRAFT_206831 [Bipolaris sorokiniana ND90Pr]EMD69148.1 hypothetical protein COCSADRAFT_206831 [Bipolaris sorokiniana ND90Pr]
MLPPHAFSSSSPVPGPSQATATPSLSRPSWTRQDVLALGGVCLAMITVLVALLGVLMSPLSLRKWLRRPFYWITRRLWPNTEYLPLSSPSSYSPMIIENWKNTDPRAVRQLWQELYNESLRVRRGGF